MVFADKERERVDCPTTPAIVVDAIKIRRIRPATSLSWLLQPKGQVESERPHPGGFVVAFCLLVTTGIHVEAMI